MTQTKMVETGLMELIVNVPNLTPDNAKIVRRDVRRALENCGSLNLLGEFTETLMVEYKEAPAEEAN